MLNNLKIRSKLLLLVGPLILLIIGLGYIAERAFVTGQSSMNTVYEDRVVPLRDLKVISDMYAVNVVDTSHKARSGEISYEQAIEKIRTARKTQRKRWEGYLATYLVDRERALINEIKPRMAAADEATDKLERILQSGKSADLASFVTHELYPAMDPVTDKLSSLIELQIEVAQETTRASNAQFDASRRQMLILIGVALVLAGALSWVIIRAINRPIAQVREALLALSQGKLSARIVDSGHKDEAGDMTRAAVAISETLQAVSHDLSGLIEAAKAGTLSVRADPARHQGEFADLIKGANDLLATLAEPLNEVASVMARLAAGDVRGRMMADYSGELRALKGNVNRSLDILVSVLDAISAYASALAEGDLTHSIEGSFQGDFASMRVNLNKAAAQLRGVLREVVTATDHISLSSRETTAAAVEVSRHASGQMSTLMDISGAIEQTAAAISEIAVSADRARQLATQAVHSAEGGQTTLGSMSTAVHGIAQKNIRIQQISELISSIADKTYVLALNAGLEAARAGEHGGGFGLIAHKISSLAEEVAQATREIRSLVQDTTTSIEEGVETATQARTSMVQIVDMSQQSGQTVQSIAAAIEEQSSMMQLLKDRVIRLQTVAQTTAGASEEISATMKSLSELSQRLKGETSRLRTA